jgi:predicted DsbA family dithiol-disulfide isomerase/uncharacterized membrane protein
MPRALILVLIRTLILIALAVSSALLFDYRGQAPAFCTTGDGCAKIRESSWAVIAGVPTPIIGVLAFVVLFGMTLLSHPRRKQWMVPTAVLGGLAAAAFIAIQAFVEHTFCKLCMIVDTAAILAAIAAVAYRYKAEAGSDGAVSTTWWSVMGALAVAAPQAFGRMQPPPEVKPAILKYWQAGKVNIVEMSDFECPFCRLQHNALAEAIKGQENKVNFVRLTVPLSGHANARPASRAYLCAKEQGKGEEMAHELFTDELTPGTYERHAAKLGLNVEEFKRCQADAKTDARVTEEYKHAQEGIGFKGLPTTWVGAQLLEGAQSKNELQKAIQEAAAGGSNRPTASPVWLWLLLVGAFLTVGGLSLRKSA